MRIAVVTGNPKPASRTHGVALAVADVLAAELGRHPPPPQAPGCPSRRPPPPPPRPRPPPPRPQPILSSTSPSTPPACSTGPPPNYPGSLPRSPPPTSPFS